MLFGKKSRKNFVEQGIIISSDGTKMAEGGGGGWWPSGAAPLQGQMYFYYTNRCAHIYLAPGGNTPWLYLYWNADGRTIHTYVKCRPHFTLLCYIFLLPYFICINLFYDSSKFPSLILQYQIILT